MVTWIDEFADTQPAEFALEACDPAAVPALPSRLPVGWTLRDDEITVTWEGGPVVRARLIAPSVCEPPLPVETQIVESHGLYHWERITIPDRHFPRIIELRADALGQVVLIGHVQRDLPGNDYAPALGWHLDFRHLSSRLTPEDPRPTDSRETTHCFSEGEPCQYYFDSPCYTIYHPAAAHRRKGYVKVARNVCDRTHYTYLRSEPGDLTPFQASAWQRFEVVIAPEHLARLSPVLTCPHTVSTPPHVWESLYSGIGESPSTQQPELAAAVVHHRDLIVRGVAQGDDWGNVVIYDENSCSTAVNAMNRLNHCPPIFFEAWRTGDRRMLEAALGWCDNFHDYTIWWGPQCTGGTRYNFGPAVDHHPPDADPGRFCWRSNRAIDFCTKGFDSFFLAYEETGDPRMRIALDAQTAAACELLHTDRGECRDIGSVREFVRLYRYTGDRHYLDQGLRLFRELTSRLWPNGLFDQEGKPETPRPPFIDSDSDGVPHGYAKIYIIGYALSGLPELLAECPEEPRLRQVVSAVADFLADAQDPAGGWRYPHPRSSCLGVGNMETSWQLVQADRVLGPQERHLDAIEKALRARIMGFNRAGMLVSTVAGWERSTGSLQPGQTLQQLYASPEDRDYTRDYDEGEIGLGGCLPDGMVYFTEVLAFYLKHREAERLLILGKDDPLARILRRLPEPTAYQSEGVREFLPAFHEKLVGRLHFPLAWSGHGDFDRWKREARAKVRECLLAPPPARAFAPCVLAKEQRDGYTTQKVVLSITGDSRVLAYLSIPDGQGPFPAVLLLHDHGARFDIGKEKVVRPFGCSQATHDSALEWIDTCYGGRFIGDELARRGYVCLATDMLNWGDRGGGGYEGQQALAANLFHLGMSFAGLIAYEDLRAAEFLATRPEVDPRRVAAMGLSVGCFRTWQVAALSNHIKAGVAICWMATVKGLMVLGNNQTGGQSAYSMIHPALHNYLDYPDVASLACPKPMLFFNGSQDPLFPVPSVIDAYEKMRRVWDSQGASDKLVTRLWDVGHVFDAQMQDEAFTWLADVLEVK